MMGDRYDSSFLGEVDEIIDNMPFDIGAWFDQRQFSSRPDGLLLSPTHRKESIPTNVRSPVSSSLPVHRPQQDEIFSRLPPPMHAEGISSLKRQRNFLGANIFTDEPSKKKSYIEEENLRMLASLHDATTNQLLSALANPYSSISLPLVSNPLPQSPKVVPFMPSFPPSASARSNSNSLVSVPTISEEAAIGGYFRLEDAADMQAINRQCSSSHYQTAPASSIADVDKVSENTSSNSSVTKLNSSKLASPHTKASTASGPLTPNTASRSDHQIFPLSAISSNQPSTTVPSTPTALTIDCDDEFSLLFDPHFVTPRHSSHIVTADTTAAELNLRNDSSLTPVSVSRNFFRSPKYGASSRPGPFPSKGSSLSESNRSTIEVDACKDQLQLQGYAKVPADDRSDDTSKANQSRSSASSVAAINCNSQIPFQSELQRAAPADIITSAINHSAKRDIASHSNMPVVGTEPTLHRQDPNAHIGHNHAALAPSKKLNMILPSLESMGYGSSDITSRIGLYFPLVSTLKTTLLPLDILVNNAYLAGYNESKPANIADTTEPPIAQDLSLNSNLGDVYLETNHEHALSSSPVPIDVISSQDDNSDKHAASNKKYVETHNSCVISASISGSVSNPSIDAFDQSFLAPSSFGDVICQPIEVLSSLVPIFQKTELFPVDAPTQLYSQSHPNFDINSQGSDASIAIDPAMRILSKFGFDTMFVVNVLTPQIGESPLSLNRGNSNSAGIASERAAYKIDDISKSLGIAARRIYDVINILESLGMLVGVSSNHYRATNDPKSQLLKLIGLYQLEAIAKFPAVAAASGLGISASSSQGAHLMQSADRMYMLAEAQPNSDVSSCGPSNNQVEIMQWLRREPKPKLNAGQILCVSYLQLFLAGYNSLTPNEAATILHIHELAGSVMTSGTKLSHESLLGKRATEVIIERNNDQLLDYPPGNSQQPTTESSIRGSFSYAADEDGVSEPTVKPSPLLGSDHGILSKKSRRIYEVSCILCGLGILKRGPRKVDTFPGAATFGNDSKPRFSYQWNCGNIRDVYVAFIEQFVSTENIRSHT